MRTCQSCGLQNPDDRDFCECGEYLRWEPTGFVQAITPELAAEAAAEAAAPAPVQAAQAPPAPRTAVQPAVRVPPAPVEQVVAETARITLRRADGEADNEHALGVSIEPGQRDRVLALVRNQGAIVDNYQLRVQGMPEAWWSIYPDTVYLVPFGTGGTYEQEVEVHLHPPRSPEAKARLWELEVVAHSKAQSRTAATAPLGLVIEPYTETATSLRPQRAKGRRRAHYDVAVENKANAPVLVALEGEDPDDELDFGFNRAPHEVPAGQTVQTAMQLRPPKQIWVGRAVEKRFTVNTLTGEQARQRLAAEPTPASELEGAPQAAPRKPGLFARRPTGANLPGVYGPRVYKPQVYKPGMNLGPGGVSFRAPQITGPQVQGPQMKGLNLDANALKLPGRPGGPSAPSGPLLPSQGVFRQKPWLPWWLIPVAVALAALAVLVYLLLPNNVLVPDLVGAKSTFDAEKQLTDADLKLAAAPKEKIDPNAPPGSIIDQTPAAGEKAERGEQVALLVAIGSAEVAVPDLAGMTLSEADAALRDKKLTLGQSAPQPPDPNGKIESQIPARNEVVNIGTPVSVFFADPDGGPADDGEEDASTPTDTATESSGEAIVPKIDGATPAAFAQRLADRGISRQTRTVYDAAPAGTLLSTEPPEGSKLGPDERVTLIVSRGAPLLAYDDEQDVLVVDGITGKRPTVVGRSPAIDKDPTFSADGERIAYQADGQVFQVDVDDPDGQPLPLTDGNRRFRDLAFAPDLERDLLAMLGEEPSTGLPQLCLGRMVRSRLETTCVDPPAGVRLGSTIRWAPDGRTLLIFGSGADDPAQFGIVRYRSSRPFSARAADWTTSGYVTDVTQPGRGALDAAFSPDGKRLAVVSNLISRGEFHVLMTTPAGLGRDPGKALGVTACKVTWRPDGIELVIMQADDCVNTAAGRLLAVSLEDPQDQRSLRLVGDNMTFPPLRLEP